VNLDAGTVEGLGPRFLVLADTIPTEAAPVFAGCEGRGLLLHELWLVELWTAFAESAVIEPPALTATSKAATKSYGFSGRNPRPPKTAESGAASVVVVFHEYGKRLGRPADFDSKHSSRPQRQNPHFSQKRREVGHPPLLLKFPSVEGVVGLGGFDFSGDY